jgi:hypothetical protein
LTVCIAAINKGIYPSIVFCADRLVTGGPQFELGEPKFQTLTLNCVVMIAGNVLQGEIITQHSKERIRNTIYGNNTSVEQITTILTEEYKKTMNHNINNDILGSLGLSVDSLPNIIGSLPNSLIKDIEEYPFRSFRIDFLVFGIQIDADSGNRTAHLYKVGTKGKMDCYTTIGFASIGSGEGIVESELTKHTFIPNEKLSEVMYRVFVAKKVAERVQGVGESTDFRILTFLPNQTTNEPEPFIWSVNNSDAMNTLERTYKEQREKEAELMADKVEKLEEELFKKPSTP